MKHMHCAIIDLANGQSSIVDLGEWELSSGNFGWGVHSFNRANRQRDISFVALSTGILTGTGVPGSGGIAWCNYQNNSSMFYPTEGRLGAALRYAGIDHLAVTGKCPVGQKADITIRDGKISVTYVRASRTESAAKAYAQVWKRRPTEDSVIAIPAPSGILEDNWFFISDKMTSSLLRNMGLRSLTVSYTGGLKMADPEKFCALTAQLWQIRRELPVVSDAEHPVRYLSVMPGCGAADTSAWPARARLKSGVLEKQMLTALGLYWGQYAETLGGLDMAAKLLSACSGDTVTVDDLRQSALALNRALAQ
jgi:hypothetical protein